jgi:hypothetical protein
MLKTTALAIFLGSSLLVGGCAPTDCELACEEVVAACGWSQEGDEGCWQCSEGDSERQYDCGRCYRCIADHPDHCEGQGFVWAPDSPCAESCGQC